MTSVREESREVERALKPITDLLQRHGYALNGLKRANGSGGPIWYATYKRGRWRVSVGHKEGRTYFPTYFHGWLRQRVHHVPDIPPYGRRWEPEEIATEIEAEAQSVLRRDGPAFRVEAREAERAHNESVPTMTFRDWARWHLHRR
jgi:hypothetical protein